MESSIAEFLERQLACELLPTVNIRTAVSSLSREVCMSRSLERRRCTQKVGSQGIHVHMAGAATHIHTFSAFWL